MDFLVTRGGVGRTPEVTEATVDPVCGKPETGKR